ncbi:hypothetical protein G5V57_15560 [Nordella sp. HKS 07]|uniref:hypothetical protein n=1 Tax=Nordella sp. HKS 07 TaxID=2712222 RepID=UPI0013E1732A|nr:hypothetical protein [Nordella sp. HKS 07]QIG49014.1 hypothetical protein G5V57_15560 [Nordella sp. HKS 07]
MRAEEDSEHTGAERGARHGFGHPALVEHRLDAMVPQRLDLVFGEGAILLAHFAPVALKPADEDRLVAGVVQLAGTGFRDKVQLIRWHFDSSFDVGEHR